MNRFFSLLVVLLAGATTLLAGCSHDSPAQRDVGMQANAPDRQPQRPRSFSDPGPNYPDTGR